ncbi:(2Fe-2S) ferredoxin domain-containing protein [Streptomyces sp. NPDC015684]|uniref:(2Fe-2S) ferredoxin domain-containing protein n=1 Tax=Streptomyces sp. NPDC015684 TaxID=3364963 RepID=UPI0036F6DA71
MPESPAEEVPGGVAVRGAGPAPCRVVVCRDCCCGTAKVTGVDHAAQTARLEAEVPVRVSACLDVCEQANVVVVQPSAAGRAAGARPVWLGLVNDPDAIEDVIGWVHAGGPGAAPMPDILDLYTFTPPRLGGTASRDARRVGT